MQEREYLLSIYEVYSNLLTEKEKTYFEYYYFEDYSLQEIADNMLVSRAYVGKILKSIENKLLKYEKALNLFARKNQIKELLKDTDKSTRNKIIELL